MQTFQDVYTFREVLFALTGKELKAQYRNMALGFVWALLNPLVMVIVLSLALVNFLGQSADAPAKLIVALIPYNFFVYCLSGGAASVAANGTLVKKVRFPRQILPFSVVLTNLVHFALQSTLIVAVLYFVPHPGATISWNLLWLPPVVVVHVGLCLAVTLLFSALNVVYRDTQYIVESLLTVMFWIAPVIYDAREIMDPNGHWTWLQAAYFANPLAGVLDSYRAVLYHGTAPDALAFGLATLVTLLLGALGIRVFFKHERLFADLIP